MIATKLSLEEQLSALKPRALDEFCRTVIDGARHALADAANPLRFTFFSTAMRILFEHMMGTLAPIEQVKQSAWFVPDKRDGTPTRRQRIVFAIQGGLADTFVKETLAVDVAPLHARLVRAVDELSKQVHGREDTVIRDMAEQDVAARAIIEELAGFLEAYHDCRSAILQPIQEELDDAAVNALISETIMEVDELATHHSLDEVCVDRISVKSLGPNSITYRAEGSISVTLQWGSNSDVRRGDGVEIGDSFPFHCDFEVQLDDLWDLSGAEPLYCVDTRDWHDTAKLDEWEGAP
jgi:Predicted pPIWI-associating nuclease